MEPSSNFKLVLLGGMTFLSVGYNVLYICCLLEAMYRRGISRKFNTLGISKAVADIGFCSVFAAIGSRSLAKKRENNESLTLLENIGDAFLLCSLINYITFLVLKSYGIKCPFAFRKRFTVRHYLSFVLSSWLIAFVTFAFATIVTNRLFWKNQRKTTLLTCFTLIIKGALLLLHIASLSALAVNVWLLAKLAWRSTTGGRGFGRQTARAVRRFYRLPLAKASVRMVAFIGCQTPLCFFYLSQILWGARNSAESTYPNFVLLLLSLFRVFVDASSGIHLDIEVQRSFNHLVTRRLAFLQRPSSSVNIEFTLGEEGNASSRSLYDQKNRQSSYLSLRSWNQQQQSPRLRHNPSRSSDNSQNKRDTVLIWREKSQAAENGVSGRKNSELIAGNISENIAKCDFQRESPSSTFTSSSFKAAKNPSRSKERRLNKHGGHGRSWSWRGHHPRHQQNKSKGPAVRRRPSELVDDIPSLALLLMKEDNNENGGAEGRNRINTIDEDNNRRSAKFSL